jgi:LPS-assembly protein
MKNNFNFFHLVIYLVFFFNWSVNANEIFNFNVSEIEISDNGNKIKGLKRGKISTNEGLIIDADNFEIDKTLNLLIASGNIKIRDKEKDIIILADKISYNKNKEIITGEKNIKYFNNSIQIEANKFQYFKKNQILSAEDNVLVKDNLRDLIILADKLLYFKNDEKIIAKNKTKVFIDSKYEFISKNVIFSQPEAELSSSYKTKIIENSKQLLEFEKFTFNIEKELLKAENITYNDNIQNSKELSNNLFFKNGFFDLKNKEFVTGEAEIRLEKEIFNNFNNDPRLIGISSSRKNNITTIDKGIFTSCKETDDCPPWTIQAKKITHDKNKKQLIYDDALLKVYNIPVFYFPKFFHPDPSVNRQSGFLAPKLSNSKILGNSFSMPYFHAISENKDFTFKPTFFDKNSQMYQAEYRLENKNSSFISDFAITNKFKSSETKEENSISHIFADFDLNLNLEKFDYSKMSFSVEKVSKDTYLKLFDNVLSNTELKPISDNVLTSEAKLVLNKENFDFNLGMSIYEDLQKPTSDRHQFILPYYDFSTNLFSNDLGLLNFSSSGSNDLKNTNNLRTKIVNDINFGSQDKIFYNYGNINNFQFLLKNTNTVANNDEQYDSNPDYNLTGLFVYNSNLPLVKQRNNYLSTFTPKISLRVNPSNMTNNFENDRVITANNIFDINRLGLDDTLESGTSITYGVDYRTENLNDSNRYTEISLATVFRDVEENSIPKKTTLNKKYSNIFGSIDHSISNFLDIGYNFSINNDLDQIDYNSLSLNVSVNNFVTKFNFIEENNIMGDASSIENTTSYGLNEKNFLTFKTRRNKKINLTEYYDLIYEYKNDCLTAGIKYKKTYYEDRDLKPSEDLMLTLTLIPLTSIDQTISQN